jgi:HK97 family phage prohead protease
MSAVFRTFVLDLDDISIRSDGTGRTVEAYAAVFDQPAEIVDFEGHYMEQIGRNAFNQTIKRNGGRFPVFYNHGRTIGGTPSDMASLPLGSSTDVMPDAKGLRTVTRYNANPLADQVLESIRNGDIRGMSWSGRIISQDIKTPRTGFRAKPDGTLTLVTRTEIALKEFGPTPFPAYVGADIVGVRSLDLVRSIEEMSDEDRVRLAHLLTLPAARPDEDAARDAGTSTEVPGSDEPSADMPPSGRSAMNHPRHKLTWAQTPKEL